MKIDDNYSIVTDAYNCSLVFEEIKMNKKGDLKSYTKEWHYGSIRQCLEKYLDECIKPSESVQEAIKAIEDAVAVIKTIEVK